MQTAAAAAAVGYRYYGTVIVIMHALIYDTDPILGPGRARRGLIGLGAVGFGRHNRTAMSCHAIMPYHIILYAISRIAHQV